MRNRYNEIKSKCITSNDINNQKITKYNFNNRFNISKEKNLKNKITNISLLNNSGTELQKEIYKNKIISKRRNNHNLNIKRQSSYSRFDNDKKQFINILTKNNKDIRQKVKILSIDYIKKKKERNSLSKNNSISNLSNIKNIDSPSNLNKESYTIGSESTSVTKKKKFQIKPYKSNKKFEINEKILTEANKENKSINSGIPLSPTGNKNHNMNKRKSFQYLIHQAYENKALSSSFCRYYKSSRSREKNTEKNEKNYKKNNILKSNKINQINNQIKNLRLLSSISNISRNNIINMSYTNKSKNSTTFLENSNNSCFGKSYNNKTEKEKDDYVKNYETMFNLLKKIKIIINKIDNYEQNQEECYDYINYYFNNLIYNKITKFFSDSSINNYFKKEIICFLLCYDISFNNTIFNQTAILLKTILNIIYSNYIIILYSIIIKNNNDYELQKYLILLENEIAATKIEYEGPILKILESNNQYINNYYKMIVDNVYKNDNIKTVENYIKFPNCLNYKELAENNMTKTKVISSFFYEAYKIINENIYSYIDLQNFFYIFLSRKGYKNNTSIYEKKKDLINNSIKNVTISNFNLNGDNQRIKYLLPKIKNGYQYSLVLDLDGTLVSFHKNSSTIILRPGLKDFLHRMKKLYELILFTSAIKDYVDPIVNFIENDEKYFDYILYRKHLSYDEKGEFFKNLNLLNRNIQKIIIVDDNEKNFKLHKDNGICIKSFNGENDNNDLDLLAQILIRIRLETEKVGDIRICLKQVKSSLIYNNIEKKYK